jgi:hypothetical protein
MTVNLIIASISLVLVYYAGYWRGRRIEMKRWYDVAVKYITPTLLAQIMEEILNPPTKN